jgi:hypothetical protein
LDTGVRHRKDLSNGRERETGESVEPVQKLNELPLLYAAIVRVWNYVGVSGPLDLVKQAR